MDKKEILEKSRMENKSGEFDERDNEIRLKSYRWGYGVIGLIACCLWAFEDNYGCAFAVFAGKAAMDIYEAIRSRTKRNIIFAICTFAIAVGWLMIYLHNKGVL